MMNDDMLRNIEYLREKADVSYEEAGQLLERFDGNVMRVLVELERQGRIYPQGHTADYERPKTPPKQERKSGADKATNFINNAFAHHVVVEKGAKDKKETVANLSAPFVAGAAVIAPHLAVASVALMFVMGYRVKIKKEKPADIVPEDVEAFVDKTVSNIKKTASSLGETVRGERQAPNPPKKDDDDNDNEGGEITIE